MKSILSRFALVSLLGLLAGGPHARAETIITDFDQFASDDLYASWASASIVSGPTSYDITATGYGSNYKYIGYPPIAGSGHTDLQLAVSLDGPPAADGQLGPIVDLIDEDGTRYSYRWYGQNLGSHVLSSAVESPTSVVNSGTTPGLDLDTLAHMHMQLDPGGYGTSGNYTVRWENLSLTGSSAPGDTDARKIYMHYMPWFDTPEVIGTNNWGLHWRDGSRRNPNVIDSTGKREIASNYYPKIGPYQSSNPHVIEYHMLLMKMAGVEGVLIDWYGEEGANGDVQLLLDNSNAIVERVGDFGMEFGVVLEDRFSRTSINGAPDIEKAKANLAYLREHYFSHPEYIRTGENDDPLLPIFGPITFEQPSQWTEILAEAGEDVEFLPLWYELGDAGANSDGEYAWIYENEILDDYLSRLESFYQSRAPGLGTVGGVAYPGFDVYGGGAFEIPHDDGQTLANLLALAEEYSEQIDFLQLATWNDFGEGTLFEPTVETGFAYLLQLQQFTGVPYGEAELQLVFDLYRARNEFSDDSLVQTLLDQASDLLSAFEINEARTIIESIYLPGDFNCDGVADAQDFLVWQRQAGSVGFYPLATLEADGNADGVVDGEDLAIWRSHYGSTSLASSLAQVPEPSVGLLVLLGLGILLNPRLAAVGRG